MNCSKCTRWLASWLAVASLSASAANHTVNASSTVTAPNFQGLWWNAPAGSESGWGINFAHQGDVIFATWFTYDATGKGWWLVMTAPMTAPNTYSGTLYRTSGPAFSAVPFNPTAVTPTQVGTGTLAFSDANNGTFTYAVNGVSQTKNITHQTFGPLPTCSLAGSDAAVATANNYQDLWWAAPGGSESGWGINFTHQGDTIFATWFTYDATGVPLWLVATAPKTGPGTYAGTLYRTAGPAFDAVPFNPASVVPTAVGSATFTFTSGNRGTFSYDVDLGDGLNNATQSKPITRQVFHAPGTVCYTASGAEGFWLGTTSNNQTARALILDDGTYYILYSKSGSSSDAGVVQGTSSTDNGTLTSSDGKDFAIASGSETADELTAATVNGTYQPRSTLQLTIGEPGGTRTLAASYDARYEVPATLAAVAGTYAGFTGHIDGKLTASLTISADGSFLGVNDACTLKGTITPRKSVNVFDFGVSAVGTEPCIFGRGPISGVMYYDEANRQIHGFAPFGSRADQWFVIGTKQ